MKTNRIRGFLFFLSVFLFAGPAFSQEKRRAATPFFQAVLNQTVQDEKERRDFKDPDPSTILLNTVREAVSSFNKAFHPTDSSDKPSEELVVKKFSNILSVDDIVALVLQRNPRLFAKKSQISAAATELGQATALEIALSQFSSFFTGSKVSLPLPALFPFPGMMTLKGRMAEETVVMAQEAFQDLRRNLAFETRIILAKLMNVFDSLIIIESDQQILKKFENVTLALYKDGKSAYSDQLSLRVRLENLTIHRQNLENARVTLDAQLKALLDVSALPDDWVKMLQRESPGETSPESGLVKIALKSRPEIRILESRIRRVSAAIAMVEKRSRPDWNLYPSLPMSPGAGQYRLAMNGEDAFSRTSTAVRVDPFFGFSQAYIAQMEFLLSSIRQEREGLLRQVRAEVVSAVSSQMIAEKNRKSFAREILPKREHILETIQTEYQNGSKAFVDLVEAETMWLSAKQGLADSIRDLHIASAALLKVVGKATREEISR